MKNYIEPFSVGVLDIKGIFSEIPADLQEGIDIGCYLTFEFTLTTNGAPMWQCWKPLICHGNEILAETNGKLVCVYGTRNCADNVGGKEVKAILNCLFDGIFD